MKTRTRKLIKSYKNYEYSINRKHPKVYQNIQTELNICYFIYEAKICSDLIWLGILHDKASIVWV